MGRNLDQSGQRNKDSYSGFHFKEYAPFFLNRRVVTVIIIFRVGWRSLELVVRWVIHLTNIFFIFVGDY